MLLRGPSACERLPKDEGRRDSLIWWSAFDARIRTGSISAPDEWMNVCNSWRRGSPTNREMDVLRRLARLRDLCPSDLVWRRRRRQHLRSGCLFPHDLRGRGTCVRRHPQRLRRDPGLRQVG